MPARRRVTPSATRRAPPCVRACWGTARKRNTGALYRTVAVGKRPLWYDSLRKPPPAGGKGSESRTARDSWEPALALLGRNCFHANPISQGLPSVISCSGARIAVCTEDLIGYPKARFIRSSHVLEPDGRHDSRSLQAVEQLNIALVKRFTPAFEDEQLHAPRFEEGQDARQAFVPGPLLLGGVDRFGLHQGGFEVQCADGG